MRARLDAARRRRASRRAPSTRPRSRSCAASRGERAGPDPRRRRRCCCARSRTRCRRRTASGRPATSRPRSSGRRTGGSRPQTYRDGARRARAADPRRPDGDASSASTSGARQATGLIDFEDLLELAVRMFEEDEHALAALRERYSAFTVDEYQDVNLLQQTLLELWLGAARRPLRGRRRLPVDLRLHRRLAGVAARAAGALPARDGGAARGELPLVAAGARAREPARAAARRRREDAARRRGPTGRSRSCAASTRPRPRTRSCRAGARAARRGRARTRRWRC